MVKYHLFLDQRRNAGAGMSQVKLYVYAGGRASLVSTGVSIPAQWWSAEAQAVSARAIGADALNARLREVLEVAKYIYSRTDFATSAEAAEALRQALMNGIHHVHVADVFVEFGNSRVAEKTRRMYAHTLDRLRDYCDNFDDLCFGDISRGWLERFDGWLSRTCGPNSRSVHLRNIRAVFNYAMDEGITDAYPFRKFKLPREVTRKRSLSVAQLRGLIAYQVEDYQRPYRDMWLLSFCLCGINMVDLCHLREVTADGRVEYNRAKTHRPYSIKVEPEAAAIIERYSGKAYLVDVIDTRNRYDEWLKRCNAALHDIGRAVRHPSGCKVVTPAFPGLTSYWARHTWATIAASLDIPRDTIAHALGHGGNTVTDIYIDYDLAKVDAANRKVLDWVFYGKRRR